MKKSNGCDFEPQVVKSLKAGLKDNEISAHLNSCADCRETAKIVSFFQTNLLRESAPKNLPTAGLVWWKTKLREKHRAANRAARPIFIAQTVAVAVALLAAIGLLIYQPEFFAPLADVLNQTLDTIGKMAFPLFAGISTLLIVSGFVILTLRRFMSEE